MGSTASARIKYGIKLPGEEWGWLEEYFPDNEAYQESLREDWEGLWYKAKSVKKPSDYNKRSKIEKERDVDIDYCGHHEYSSQIIAIQSWAKVVDWSEVEVISLTELQSLPTDEWDKKLRDFCDALKIPYQQPSLLLCTHYG
jgi:hypothetical protein